MASRTPVRPQRRGARLPRPRHGSGLDHGAGLPPGVALGGRRGTAQRLSHRNNVVGPYGPPQCRFLAVYVDCRLRRRWLRWQSQRVGFVTAEPSWCRRARRGRRVLRVVAPGGACHMAAMASTPQAGSAHGPRRRGGRAAWSAPSQPPARRTRHEPLPPRAASPAARCRPCGTVGPYGPPCAAWR